MSPSLPSIYKAAVYSQPGENRIELKHDVPMPEPGAGEVLIHLTHSGVCHSDLAVMMNSWAALPFPTPAGQVGGHEGVGVVVKLGVGTEQHRSMGDRVGVKWLAAACGICKSCIQGFDGACISGRKVSGYFTPGTFQQYVLAPSHYVTAIPDGLESAAAAPILCAGLTVFSALRRSGLRGGQSLVILGAGGGLGHYAVQIASRGMGVQVIAVDHSTKGEMVRKSGAQNFVAFDKVEDAVAEVKALTSGDGAHASIVVAGNNRAYAQGLSMIRHGGKLVCVGIPEGEPEVIAGAFPAALIFKEISIIGSAVGNRLDAAECLDMAAKGVIDVPYRLEKLDRLQDVFSEMIAGTLQGRVVLELGS